MPKQTANQPKRAAKRGELTGKKKKEAQKPPVSRKETKAPKAPKASKAPKTPKTPKAAKPPKAPKAPKAPKGGKGKKILAAVLLALVLGTAYAALCMSVNPDLVLPRTRMVYRQAGTEGVDESRTLELGNLTREAALKSLEEDFHRRYDGRSITVRANDTSFIVPVGAALSVDAQALADQAMAPSQVPMVQRGLSRLRSLLMDRDIEVAPEVGNQTALHASLQSSGVLGLDTTVQTTYEIKDKKLVFHKGRSGQSVDQDALTQQIADAVLAGDFDTPVESAMREGKVDEMDWAAVQKDICVEPKNAELKLKRNRRRYEIVDAVTGVSFDADAAQKLLARAAEGTDISVDLKYSAPEITTKRMKNKLFKHKLGTFTTWVSGTSDRISNVRLAAEKCDGIILCKGDTFSYNDTLGERTQANGFREAGAYLNGETVQEVGGGICQISSTMYAACLDANLKILERHNHTFASSYIGLGMDATVSWGGPDFRIENDKEYPIKIEASYWDGRATVTIWGTRTDKITVEMVSETKETIPFSTITREDPDMYEGKTRISQKGSDGYRVQTYRVLYDDGKEISREKEAYSVYTPHTEIVYEGTKVREPKPEKKEPEDESKEDETGQDETQDGQDGDETADAAAEQTEADQTDTEQTN